jgi:hypothetical protein
VLVAFSRLSVVVVVVGVIPVPYFRVTNILEYKIPGDEGSNTPEVEPQKKQETSQLEWVMKTL